MKLAIAVAVLGAMLAAGCATQPQAPDPLAQARSAYQQASANPDVPRFAPNELAAAGEALTRAERAQASNAGAATVSHQAYLAQRQAEIATQHAMARAAETQLARAATERERVMLQARARRAEEARAQTERRLEQAQAEREMQARDMGAELRQLESQLADLQARETDRGLVLALGSEVLFDSGEALLKPGARRALDQVASVLRERPERSIAVEGFTDSVGSDAMNQALSERRAEAVRRALVGRGIDASRVSSRGLGESFPVASNASAAGRQLNRRVEIVILHEGTAAAGGRQ